MGDLNCKCMCVMLYLKGLVHPKMKIIQFFTHPQAILGVYDFLLCFRRPL